MKTTTSPEHQPGSQHDRGINLWLWVGGGFLLLMLAWGVMFVVARSAKVESVPLATQEARS